MTTRNWRTKQIRSGCDTNIIMCKVSTTPIAPYIPTTLEITTFDNLGNFTWTAPPYVTSIEYLIVGGGGGGGAAYDTGSAGGGGAGLVLADSVSVIPGSNYNIIVGDGGDGGVGNRLISPAETNGANGSDSAFDTIIAYGGGGGIKSRVSSNDGLGGNAANGLIPPTGGNGAGNRIGGDNGGGGGGNSTAGGSSTLIPGLSNSGGLGLTSNISGNNVIYGAGGEGGLVDHSYNGSNASGNTGNGGGGATSVSSDSKSGGKGGSGIVILKYYI